MEARNDSDDDSDDEIPSTRRLLSPEYQQKLVRETFLAPEDTSKKTVGETMDNLSGFASTAGNSKGR
jgi:hypothetical protein